MSDTTINDAIESAQLQKLTKSSTKTLIVGTIVPLFLALMQFTQHYDGFWVLVWFLSILVTNSVRMWFARFYERFPVSDPLQVKQRLKMFRAGVLLSSLIWGSNALIVFSVRDGIEQQMLLAYMLAGMTSGAIVAYSVDRFSATCYLFFAMVPFQIGLLTVNSMVGYEMLFTSIFYQIHMFYAVTNISKSFKASLVLQMTADDRDEQIRHMAFYDALTNLPNRRLLVEKVEQALSNSRRTGKSGAIMFIDLDNFKELNDTYGHDMGDLLLLQVAERMREALRESDTVSRIGGDEFVVMAENLTNDPKLSRMEASQIINHLAFMLSRTYKIGSLNYQTSMSIGVALFSEHGDNYNDLLRNADAAMYKAKRDGKNRWSLYETGMSKPFRHLEYKVVNVDMSTMPKVAL